MKMINREDYGKINVLYGIKCYDDMLFRDEFLQLFYEGDKQNVSLLLSYEDSSDKACYQLSCEKSDRCMSGVVTKLFQLKKIASKNAYAVICGPPIMYKFVIKELLAKGIPERQIILSLERHMKCGLGKCGHCQIEDIYCCQDGPVFSYDKIKDIKGAI